MGFPTVKAIWANKVMPEILDRYLASLGYDSQQTDEPVDAQRLARRRSAQLWVVTHGALAAFAAAVVAGAGLALLLLQA